MENPSDVCGMLAFSSVTLAATFPADTELMVAAANAALKNLMVVTTMESMNK